MERRFAQLPAIDIPGGGNSGDPGTSAIPQEVATEAEANLVSSAVAGMEGIHMPAIDIDLPCRLIESSTPGHFHLYIDQPMSWEHYKGVLAALTKAGVVQMGFYENTLRKGASHLRKPGHKKVPA